MRAWALARFACAVFSWFSAVVLSMRARTCPAVTVCPAVTSTSVRILPLEVQREVLGRDRVPRRGHRLRHRSRAHSVSRSRLRPPSPLRRAM